MTKLPAALFLFFLTSSFAQENIPLGSWRSHLSYQDAELVELAGERVYVSTGSGLFFYDISDNSLNRLTTVSGFYGGRISALAYDPASGILITGYDDGTLDYFQSDEVTEQAFIREFEFADMPRINDIEFYQDHAYIAVEFGVVVYNIPNQEVSETYQNLGVSGDEIEIFSIQVRTDSIFLASEEGVLAASLAGSNLQDFNNWKHFGVADGLPAMTTANLSSLGNALVTSIDNDGIYTYTTGSWIRKSYLTGRTYSSMESNGNQLLLVSDSEVWRIDTSDNTELISAQEIDQPSFAIPDPSGSIWIADGRNGLVTNNSGAFENFFPDGPFSDTVFRLRYYQGKIFALPGGYNESGNPEGNDLGFYIFENGFWTNYNSVDPSNSQAIPAVLDITDAVYVESRDQYVFSSFGYGLLTWDDDFQIIDENTAGSPLVNLQPPDRFVQIPAAGTSDEGLWVANYGAATPLHLLDNEDNWSSFSFPISVADYPLQLVSDELGNIWIRLDPSRGGGILVTDSEGSFRYLSDQAGNGGLPSEDTNDIIADREGQIWIATELGIGFFPFPGSIFDGDVDAFLPISDSQLLLRNEKINAIESDGGNRIWIGTEQGVFLYDPDQEEVVNQFNTGNSPLISNRVLDIAINANTGEVFFATDQGIVSYRSDASSSRPFHSNVVIFPNPVPPNFNGIVGISGLATDAIVKITDLSGQLVREVRSEGGTATWNVTDFRGENVRSGVYLVFSSSEDGEDTFVGKIAVVR